MKRIAVLCLLALPLASHAATGSCEENFQTSGDPRNGAAFVTSVTLPGLNMRSALGQMQKIALDDGFQIGNESFNERDGTLTLMQKSAWTTRGFVINVTADADGKVGINTRLPRDMVAKAEDIRGSMCKMLARLKTGAEGDAIAAAARAKSGVEKVINIKAHDLAEELADAVRNKQELEPVAARYLNKLYRIDGQIGWKSDEDSYVVEGDMRMNFITLGRKGLLGIKEDVLMQQLRPQILCVMAPDQGEYFKGLRGEDWATVIGKVVKFERTQLTLENCRRD